MNGTPQSSSVSRTAEVRYRVRHRTEYKYSENVAICQNQIRMQPVGGRNVVCEHSELVIQPAPTNRDEHFDYFGNRVVTFSIEAVHQSLTVEAVSLVRVAPPQDPHQIASKPWESLLRDANGPGRIPGVDEHRYRSPRIAASPAFAHYASRSFPPGGDAVRSAIDLTQKIHNEFRYDATATTVSTSTEDAFALRAGVCQDFAHVQIACLRSLGLAARYVSGYLRTTPPPGEQRLIGADESHAWLELHAGPDLGWIGLDPTNGCAVTTDHIPICRGRDYDDVSPMRGVVLGGGTHNLIVSVDVEPVAQ